MCLTGLLLLLFLLLATPASPSHVVSFRELATALPPVRDDLVSSPAGARGSAPALLAELKAELGKGAAQASVTRLRQAALALAYHVDRPAANALLASDDAIETLFTLSALKDPIASELVIFAIEECLLKGDRAADKLADWADLVEDFLGDRNPAVQVHALRILRLLADAAPARAALLGAQQAGLRRVVELLVESSAVVAVPWVEEDRGDEITLVRVQVPLAGEAVPLLQALLRSADTRTALGQPALHTAAAAALSAIADGGGLPAGVRRLARECLTALPGPTSKGLPAAGTVKSKVLMVVGALGLFLFLSRRWKGGRRRRSPAVGAGAGREADLRGAETRRGPKSKKIR